MSRNILLKLKERGMNMIKNKILTAVALLGIAMLPACNYSEISKSDSLNDINSSGAVHNFDSDSEFSGCESSHESASGDESNSINIAVDMVKHLYNINLPIIPANDALEIIKIDLPEFINGHFFNINQLIDKYLVISLFDKVGVSGIDCGSGLYNIESNEFFYMPGLPDDGYCAWNEDYIVYKEYDGDFLNPSDDESVNLYLYDLNNQKSKLIYTYSFDRNVEFYGGHWKNNIVIADNKIYFDDYIRENEDDDYRAFLLSYDIFSGEINKLEDDAQNPLFYNNSLVYFKLNNGIYNKIDSANREIELNVNGNIMAIVSLENSILSLDVLSNDEIKQETTWGIKNMLEDEYILKTTRTISDLVAGDNFAGFTDYGANYPPIIYNSKDNNFIVFNDLIGKSVIWYFYKDIGVVRTVGESPEAYMFRLI